MDDSPQHIDLTPANMLKFYRAHSSPDQNAQAQQFGQMSMEERLEMLFYMNVHLAAGLQAVHALVDRDAAVTTAVSDIPQVKGN